MPSTDPFLVRVPTGTMFLVEQDVKRTVRSGLIAAALEQSIGAARDASDREVKMWADGDPVEVMEVPGEAPFVVVNGTRRPLRGLPVARSVDPEALDEFPEGSQLDIAAANVSRLRYQQAISARTGHQGDTFDRLARLARRVARKARREVRRIKS